MRVVMTERDHKILDFIKEFKCASTTTIHRIFFPNASLNMAEKRLSKLVSAGKLRRHRETILDEYCYYNNKRPTNIKHCLMISKVYSLIREFDGVDIIKHATEYEIKYYNKSLRVDLMCVIRKDNKLIPLLIEVDLSKSYNNKYSEYISKQYYRYKFPIEPIVVVISNRTPKSYIPIKHYKLDELEVCR